MGYIPGAGALPDVCTRLPGVAQRPRASHIYQAGHECLEYNYVILSVLCTL